MTTTTGINAPTLTTQPTVSATTTSTATNNTTNPTSITTTNSQQQQPKTVSVPTPSTLKNKSMEEILNSWNKDLNTHTREFHKQAAQVAAWDRQLIENGNKVNNISVRI